MSELMTHERARRLAAVRLDQALTPGDEAALETHLEGCADCRAVAAGYAADRLALRSMAPVEPPRDLWARTSAALEREHARRPSSAPRGPRRWGPVAILSGGVALVLVIAIAGPGLLNPAAPAPGPVAIASGAIVPPASAEPGVTPVTLPPTEVTWVVTKGSGGVSLVTASVSKVCPTGDEPDCAPLAGISRSLADLPTVPSSLVLSPSNASQAVAIGPAPDQVGTTLFVMAVPSAAPSTPPSRPPSASPSSGPVQSAPPSSVATPAGSPPAPAPSPAASVSPTPGASSSPTPSPLPSPSTAINPLPSGAPAPSAAATLAILSNVTLVGDQAAYSPDGQWFAFSARPAGTATGPDIYVWQAGWPAALPITTDHGSVFSGWVNGQILASRAEPIAADASPAPSAGTPSDPSASASPLASAQPPVAPLPSPSQPAGASASFPADSSQPTASPSGPAPLATPAAYLIDPATGIATRIVGLDGWRPVVDPSGRWVAYWAGTLSFDADSGMWLPFQGGLQVASWAIVSTAPDGPTGGAAAHALPLQVSTDWDVRWDRTGEHLGVWVADSNNPGLGSLSLLTIDPSSGLTSSAPPIVLNMTPALRGFALRDGQLVWATPPGQDGTGSQLSVLAWSGPNAGRTSVQPIEGGALIVVP
jgi:hypothetical protein